MSKEQILRDVFYNPETGFGGATALSKKVKSQGINLKEVKEWLSKQNVTQQTKKTTGKLQSFIPSKPLYQFQVDLIVLLQKKHHIKQKLTFIML